MAVSDADGIVYYRFVYDTYGELSDITTDDGVSLKSSEQLTEYRLAELAHATGIDYLYNGQYGVETDQNGLYYMRARYYNQDIKRFINRDVVSGDISNSQSLNRYCYVQGNPVSLTDPFGLCPDPNSNFKNFCKFLYYTDWSAIGHAALDVAGLFWDGADVINALWYALERNPEMAIASAIFAIPGAGIGIGNLMMKSEKLASAGKAVRAVSKLTQSAIGVGAGMSIATVGYQNLRHSIEAGEFSLTDLATFIGGLTIAAISGKGLISSGKDFASIFDDVGKTSKAGKGYLTDADVNSMPIGGNQAKVSSLSPGSSRAVTGACFVAGTLIKTDDGYQTVEDIVVGDYVYAKNTETGEVGYKQVVRLFRKQVTELVHLQIGNEKIDTTTNHPFWVDGYGFKEAGELAEGDLVENAEGILLPVISVSREQLAEPVAVYNFEVEDWHTYYVSEEEVLVHNDCGKAVGIESGIPAGYYQDVNGRWHRPNGQFASNAEVGLPSPVKSTSGSHGNSLSDTRTNYGYALVDRDTNEILKFGETIYPNSRYSQKYLDDNNAVMKILETGDKEYIHNWQHDMNEYIRQRYGSYPRLSKKGW